MSDIEFKDFGKITRFRKLEMLILEKIDGTNAQIFVPPDPAMPVLAGSRNRWITPEKDNYGFARFVYDNAEVFRRLGPGRHFGEWWGAGIQRRYNQTTKFFSLFNVERYSEGLPEGLPENVDLVPILYRGPVDSNVLSSVVEKLYATGSVRVPGWMQPEGVVILINGQRYKITDNGDAHKGTSA